MKNFRNSFIRNEVVTNPNPDRNEKKGRKHAFDLGNGSEVIYIPDFRALDESWEWLEYLDKQIPWTRPSIRVFGRSCIQKRRLLELGVSTSGFGPGESRDPWIMIDFILQPRDTCYIADKGLPELRYSGYQPHAYSWDDYPPLRIILAAVHEALPGSSFNSLLLNRYKNGSDSVAWHSDDEKLYGPAPEIASASFGYEREFLLKKKPNRTSEEQSASKSLKDRTTNQHSFTLKHGSLLVMRGFTQRDWVHCVPKRAKADNLRINLTFRNVLI